MDASHPAAPPPTLREGAALTLRVGLVGVLLIFGYVSLRQLTYSLFAPELEVLHTIVPDGGLRAGEPVTVGVVVRNRGPQPGASFVVAVTGGVETEGPTLEVPARDTAVIPVQVTLNSGVNPVSLVVFDGWRGVRQLRAYRSLQVRVEPRSLDVHLPEQTVRGALLPVAFSWSNPGVTRESVVPVVVFRSEAGGQPVSLEGPEFQLAPGESRKLEFALDTWPLRAGRYTLDVYLEAPDRERVAGGNSPHWLEVMEP